MPVCLSVRIFVCIFVCPVVLDFASTREQHREFCTRTTEITKAPFLNSAPCPRMTAKIRAQMSLFVEIHIQCMKCNCHFPFHTR